MTAQVFFFFDIGPLRSTSLLMTANTLTEFLVPYMCCRYIDGALSKAQCQFFGMFAFARPLTTSD